MIRKSYETRNDQRVEGKNVVQKKKEMEEMEKEK